MSPGSHQSETPNGRRICVWTPGPTSLKRLMIVLYGPSGGLTPAGRFANAKKPSTGRTIAPVSGIGDDAFFRTIGMLMNFLVEKDDSVFQMKLGGFAEAGTQTMEKTLARDAVSKL